MKILCIIGQDIDHVMNGGAHVAKRNYDIIREINSTEDIYTCIIFDGNNLSIKKRRLNIPGLHGGVDSVYAALWGCKVYAKKYEKNILQYINEIQPDLIYIDSTKLGRIVKYVKKHLKHQIIVYMHNVERDYSRNQIGHRGIAYIFSYIASCYNEAICVKEADKVICITKRDAERTLELYGRKANAIIPVSFHDRYEEKNINLLNGKELLFIGSLFPPNYDGIKWFVENVMSKLPNVHLTIVGKGFEKVKNELTRSNVSIVGTVNNLDEYYYKYPVIVMPIRYGNGMKVKTAEALMFAKIIIGSSEAFEGYDIQGCKGIYECNTAREFASSIKKVFANPIYVNEDARNLFLHKYEYTVTQEQFKNVIVSDICS